ncbi:MAG: PQQ-binding-like beta-propeller repeat protein, partial [Acidobacteriota bacterium]
MTTHTKVLLASGVIAAFTILSTITAQQPRAVDAHFLKLAGTSKDTAPGTWVTNGLNQEETRYSLLKQIDATNVGKLGLSWMTPIGKGGGNQEGTPLMWNDTLYTVSNWSIVSAINARDGKVKWTYEPKMDEADVRRRMCCGQVNRGLAIAQGMVFVPVNDGRLVALDALGGQVKWESRVSELKDWYSLTIAPRIAGDKVVIGVAGGDHPIRGFVDAYYIKDGKRAWRFWTVPGDPAKGFEDKAQEAAAKTWGPGKWWEWGGGGSVWDGLAYDADTNMVYAGTGNAEPWSEGFRGSKDKDNLYTCSIIAIDASSGKLKWHYQTVPNDQWDFDSVGGFVMADISIKGKTRKVIMQAPKSGVFYIVDRTNGEFISAEPFVQINWATGFDPKTGRAILNKDAFYNQTTQVTIYPGGGGAHNWAQMSFNPMTGLVYLPKTAGSYNFRAAEEVTEAGGGHHGLAVGRGGAASFKTVTPQPIW